MVRRSQPDSSLRRRGRPRQSGTDEGDARRRLLDAAARHFAGAGFAGTSLRRVAQEAEVTPAMVSYYFKDKSGLLEAVLLEGLELVLARLRQALGATQATGGALLPRFVQAYLGALNDHPWIPRIIVQEVISKDTPLRDLFVERFANEALRLVAPMLREEVRMGRLRRDLDTRLTVMSVIGMCVFPYIAEPLLGRLLDYRIDPAFAEAFIPHTVALLERGLGAAP
jgi:AcrR family transcriptional regulator